MFTVKLKDILLSQKIISEISNMKLKFRVIHTLSIITPELISNLQFIEDNRLTLVEKYKDDSGNVAPENMKMFETEFNELLSIDVELSGNKIKSEDIEDIEVDYTEYLILKPFLE